MPASLPDDIYNSNTSAIPKIFRWPDAVVMLIVIAVSTFTFPTLNKLNPEKVDVYKENRLVASYPIEENRTFTIEGSISPVEITINDRTVSVTRSGCPHGICIKTGPISRTNSSIVCAPNHILVTISSKTEDSLDAIAR